MKVAQFRKVQAYNSLEKDDASLLADYLQELQSYGQIELYTHIAHGANISSMYQRMKLKREGWKKGFPDYVIVSKDAVIFLELKRASEGRVSPEQREWLTHLDNKQTKAIVTEGYHETVRRLNYLLSIDEKKDIT